MNKGKLLSVVALALLTHSAFSNDCDSLNQEYREHKELLRSSHAVIEESKNDPLVTQLFTLQVKQIDSLNLKIIKGLEKDSEAITAVKKVMKNHYPSVSYGYGWFGMDWSEDDAGILIKGHLKSQTGRAKEIDHHIFVNTYPTIDGGKLAVVCQLNSNRVARCLRKELNSSVEARIFNGEFYKQSDWINHAIEQKAQDLEGRFYRAQYNGSIHMNDAFILEPASYSKLSLKQFAQIRCH